MPAIGAGVLLLWAAILPAQSPAGVTPLASTASFTRTVTGRVINGLTGVPIARALVNLNARTVLTDAQGRFAFPGFADKNGYAQVSKPGYTASAVLEASRMQGIPDLDAPIELKLYQDALLNGTVSGPDGLPLARMQVRLLRLSFGSGGPRWINAGSTQTDFNGEYRFDTPSGRYRVNTGYIPRSQERGEAVLPIRFPAVTAGNDEYFELAAGEQRQIDLRPRVSPPFPVRLTVDGGDGDRGARLTAINSAGVGFQVNARRDGEVSTLQLPAGTFVLRAISADRDATLIGEARVVVTPSGAQATLHLAPAPVFSVEIISEPALVTTASEPISIPSSQQFNLTLHNLASEVEGLNSDARLVTRPDRPPQFQVQPGRYRLAGIGFGPWYIRAATCGVTDLLTEELVVAGGAGGSPIRLVISNVAGHVHGSVTIAGHPATGWVYLLPQQPNLVPYYEIYIQPDGTYQWSGAPGRYIAVPSDREVREDFRDTIFLQKFSSAGRAVEVTVGSDTIADLTLAAPGVDR